ncbi:lipocalin-like domain-containing protein [Tropicimonas sp. IMCC34043]|uniref:lipocalin-like domain-containing protein n=1 Tax=Tropicimonas sp. IMCC34043 TaxID=2248760 RepID=UPI000E22E949|nr:lipocalin-like domain-containing protein [Tropicimonas sp. IMCC34043]
MSADPAPSSWQKYLIAAFAAAATLASPGAVPAQGYAGMAQTAAGFALPDPDRRFGFPADHGPHYDFRLEWWYLTANLTGPDGAPYGVQWTLFRSALAPGGEREGWLSPEIWMGHAAVTTPGRHEAAQKFARGGIGQAGVTAEPFEAWIDQWRLAAPGDDNDDDNDDGDGLDRLRLTASTADFAYDLALTATGPIVPQGRNGYSVKSPEGQASHYYSQPFYRIDGTLTLEDTTVPVAGQGWLDREWSSQPLSETQQGWDWVSLHFESGAKLMAYRLRDAKAAPFTPATWIAADGTPTPLPDGAVTMTPGATTRIGHAEIPTEWDIALPEKGLEIHLRALNPRAWNDLDFAYWEGPVRVTGSHPGVGYLEMTGYGE